MYFNVDAAAMSGPAGTPARYAAGDVRVLTTDIAGVNSGEEGHPKEKGGDESTDAGNSNEARIPITNREEAQNASRDSTATEERYSLPRTNHIQC
jgi:hypothetical protein